MNLPNIITILRLFLTPLIVWLVLSENYILGFIFFVFSGLSDALDGYLAKKLNQSSLLGSYLDPIADKVLIVSTILVLGYNGLVPIWLIIIIVSRDIAIFGAVLISFIIGSNLKIKPLKCKSSDIDQPPDTVAYLQVIDISDKKNDQVFVFNGWTFASSPTLRSLDHAIYDLWLLGCSNT